MLKASSRAKRCVLCLPGEEGETMELQGLWGETVAAKGQNQTFILSSVTLSFLKTGGYSFVELMFSYLVLSNFENK